MRTTPSGPVYDRLEPETLRQQILLPLPKSPSQVRARELLYTHFHTEKYKRTSQLANMTVSTLI